MWGMKPGRSVVVIAVLATLVAISGGGQASAAVLHSYTSLATMDDAPNYTLSIWSSNVGGEPASYWSGGEVHLGSFYGGMRYSQFPDTWPTPDVTYKNVPFTIQIMPTVTLPSSPGGYQYTLGVTGPAYDGAVLHGVLNGTFHSDGGSDVTATFTSVTPFDVANYYRQDLKVSYTVDPSLPNLFPIENIVLPGPIHVNPTSFTDINIQMLHVPEPTSLLIFLPLFAALGSRSRAFRRSLAGALVATR
ncbi:hypothetical protein OJF2_36860 [Aquisphaera giovannonii]|uniref:PEP-CTERM protein-sorting domain-containing protein n=1 Tax=Aquisphaera giovannonii TaxID=406548 RepID=A0A5B9W538_9BACT|nr:hypothetical protein [Aquisphaera giovannonii]QEH35141.1 hypothetical protein OJF2_36860 [Aquisphaera giovannonii]